MFVASVTTNGEGLWVATYERGGGRHYMLIGDNVEPDRSALSDGPRVGDLRGGHIYRCLGW